MLFAAPKSTCVYLWLFAAVLELSWAEDVSKNSEMTDVIRLQRMSSGVGSTSCLVPKQPINGRWKLHRQFCDNHRDCDIPQGLMVTSGTYLVYRCDKDYKVEGDRYVYCRTGGTWSAIPSCVEIKCGNLNTVSRTMTHSSYSNIEILDGLPVRRHAYVSCRFGYKRDQTGFSSLQAEIVECSANGRWEPTPLTCQPVCGLKTSASLSMTGVLRIEENKDSPWHASLYFSNGTRKNLRCGATLVRPKILLTAAMCVYDQDTGIPIDLTKLFVLAGNTVTDYDSPMNDYDFVKKAAVKSVHLVEESWEHPSETVAILELQESIDLSRYILPACLDNHKIDKVDPGELGTLFGLGESSFKESTEMLQNLTVPYISESPDDEGSFIASSTNGSGICGSGIVFEKDDLWYIRGILTTDVYGEGDENGERNCNGPSHSRYIAMSRWIFWVSEKILELDSNDIINSTTTTPSPTPDTASRIDGIISNSDDSFCLVPPPPKNGAWRIYEYRCKDGSGCKISEGAKLKPGIPLIYDCASGYKASGSTEIYCGRNGNWSATANCIEVRCDALISESITASCSLFGKKVSCDYPVPPETRAQISCSTGYRKDTVFVVNQRNILSCTKDGKWTAEPIRCVPVCGVAITHQTPLVMGGTPAEIGDFPWHATLYRQRNSRTGSFKEFTCGATIIHRNYLLTAAHCIYVENSRTVLDPASLFVMTGNIFRDFDSPAHNPVLVRKSEVKNVHTHYNYYGLRGNYASDIALLELRQPFEISEILLPACLDVNRHSEQILEPGAYGKVAGFGRTATGVTSSILQTITLPYVSYAQCKNTSYAEQNDHLISDDKFCAGYTNGTSVCEGDSGGGLVFRKNQLWYVMGIVSVGLGVDFEDGEQKCDKHSYALYTKVPEYMVWIQDVISNAEQYKL